MVQNAKIVFSQLYFGLGGLGKGVLFGPLPISLIPYFVPLFRTPYFVPPLFRTPSGQISKLNVQNRTPPGRFYLLAIAIRKDEDTFRKYQDILEFYPYLQITLI